MGLWARGLGSGVSGLHFQLSVRIMAEIDGMCARLCGNMWWLRAAIHGATVPLLDAFILLFVLYEFSCNILLTSDLSPVFLKYRTLVNSFPICETCFIIWRHLFTVPLVFHSLDWSALVLPDPHPPIIFSEVLDCLIASHSVDLEIKRIVSFRSWTDMDTTNSDPTCQILGKSIYDTLFSNLNRFPLLYILLVTRAFPHNC